MSIRSKLSGQRGITDGGLLACVVVVVVVIVGFFGSVTWKGTPPDKIGLHYTGGPLQGTHYVGVIQPGTGKRMLGLRENLFPIPSTTRTYIISKNATEGDVAGADHISAPSKDRVAFTFEAAVSFTVNADPTKRPDGKTVIQQWFEEVCLHDKCYTDKGWDKMLARFFRKPLELAIAQEAKKYDSADLYANPDTLAAMNKAISKSLADDINESIGIKNSFCGPNESSGTKCGDFRVIIKNPTPPESVIKAYNDTKAQAQNVLTAQQKAQAVKAEAEGQADAARAAAEGDRDAQNTRASAKSLSQAQLDYLRAQALLKCAGNQNCTLVVTQSPSGAVNINTGG